MRRGVRRGEGRRGEERRKTPSRQAAKPPSRLTIRHLHPSPLQRNAPQALLSLPPPVKQVPSPDREPSPRPVPPRTSLLPEGTCDDGESQSFVGVEGELLGEGGVVEAVGTVCYGCGDELVGGEEGGEGVDGLGGEVLEEGGLAGGRGRGGGED